MRSAWLKDRTYLDDSHRRKLFSRVRGICRSRPDARFMARNEACSNSASLHQRLRFEIINGQGGVCVIRKQCLLTRAYSCQSNIHVSKSSLPLLGGRLENTPATTMPSSSGRYRCRSSGNPRSIEHRKRFRIATSRRQDTYSPPWVRLSSQRANIIFADKESIVSHQLAALQFMIAREEEHACDETLSLWQRQWRLGRAV